MASSIRTEVTPRTRLMIAGACAVTVIIAALGMDSMWGSVEWIEQSDRWSFGRDPFLYQSGLAIALAAVIVALWLPRFEVSRLLRVAVLLPVVHIGAIVVAGFAWSALRGDIAEADASLGFTVTNVPKIALPSAALLVVAFGIMLAFSVLLKRKHGEWAHASVMMALSFLLLLGLWLPMLSRLSVSTPGAFNAIESLQRWGPDSYYWSWQWNHRLFGREAFNLLAVIPPALCALGFTVLVFRASRWFARVRRHTKLAVKLLLGGAILAALTLPNEGWLLYLESSYLVMFGVVLAIGSLITLTVVSRLGSLAAHFNFRRLPKLEGVIARDEEQEAARFEITSWLRGPRLVTRSFVVMTPYGNVPLTGVNVLAAMPSTTTTLDVGEHAPVFAPGDRVVIAGRKSRADGGPFRAADAADVVAIAAPDARPYRFSDVTLVVWRPAVAYLAIMLAVALPYLSIVVT